MGPDTVQCPRADEGELRCTPSPEPHFGDERTACCISAQSSIKYARHEPAHDRHPVARPCRRGSSPLSIKLYEAERISLGKAAELAGYSKRAFMEVLSKEGIPVINISPEDLNRELGR